MIEIFGKHAREWVFGGGIITGLVVGTISLITMNSDLRNFGDTVSREIVEVRDELTRVRRVLVESAIRQNNADLLKDLVASYDTEVVQGLDKLLSENYSGAVQSWRRVAESGSRDSKEVVLQILAAIEGKEPKTNADHEFAAFILDARKLEHDLKSELHPNGWRKFK